MTILFIVANLVVASIAINSATKESMNFARELLGADVKLTYDIEKAKEQMMGGQRGNEPGSNPRTGGSFEVSSIYLSEVENIADSKYVLDYRVGLTLPANSVDFEPVESEVNEQFKKFKSDMEMTDLNFVAVNAYALLDVVENGTINLLEGESFDETNTNSVIVSYDLAINNDLEIGSTITVQSVEEVEETYTVIGIYEFTEVESQDAFSMQSRENNIYTNFKSILPLLNEETYNEEDYAVDSIKFYLNDPENMDAFIEDATMKIEGFEDRNLMLDANNDSYEKMVGPISSLGDSSKNILIAIVIATVAILSLIIVNSIESRNHEIGVLLSLGEKKVNIASQLLVELILISTVAFGASFLTSTYISQKLGDSLLEKQIEVAEEVSKDSFGRGNMKFLSKDQKSEDVETIDEININIDLKDYGKLFAGGYLIIFLSMIIPTSQILRYDPKKILTRTEG